MADVLEVPLSHLFNDANSTYYQTDLHGSQFTVREYAWGDYVITGATAAMLREFLSLAAAQAGYRHI